MAAGASLTEAVGAHDALGPETMQILVPAEQAGDLEGALQRAAERRRHTLLTRASVVVRLLSVAVTATVMLLIAYRVLSFYSGLYGALR